MGDGRDGNYIPGTWKGTPLADVSAWVGVGKTDIAELSTQGGSIIAEIGGSLITRSGSLLDVSGGSVRYADGWIKTTKLLGADGRSLRHRTGRPRQVYRGFRRRFYPRSMRTGASRKPGRARSAEGGARYERVTPKAAMPAPSSMSAAKGSCSKAAIGAASIVGERQAAAGKLAQAGTLTFGGKGDDDRQWLLGNLIISNNPVRLPADFSATTPLASSWYSGAQTITGSVPAPHDLSRFRCAGCRGLRQDRPLCHEELHARERARPSS